MRPQLTHAHTCTHQAADAAANAAAALARTIRPPTPSRVTRSSFVNVNEARTAFLRHRAEAESSLEGTGMTQSDVIELLAELVLAEAVHGACDEVDDALGEMSALLIGSI